MSATDDVTFEVDGKSYPFVFPDGMTFPEQRELKRLSGGLTPANMFEMMSQFDPDAWCALLLVCMRRVDAAIKDDALDGITPMPLAIAVFSALDEAQAKDAAEVEEGPLGVAASAAEPEPAPPPAASPEAERTRDAFGALV